MIRFPRLMDMAMQEFSIVLPARLSVTECLTPLSTAELVLVADSPVPPVRCFMELYDQNGSLGIYRVAATHADYGRQNTVSLEHGICTMEDCTGPEEAALSGSMRTILAAILSWQHEIMWQLGEVDVPDSETYSLDEGNQIGLQALLDAAALVHGYAYAFDQTTTPWTLHLKKLRDTFSSMCRVDGNISSLGISYDESELCTRVTSPLLANGYLDGPTVSSWGVVSRPLDVEEDATAEHAAVFAAEYLEEHKNPRVSMEVDAVELAQRTGSPYDNFRLGDVCRVMTDDSTHYDERIITIYRPDVYGAPENARLTLSTQARTTAASLAGMRASYLRQNRSNQQQFKYIREELDRIVIEAPTVELLARIAKIEEVNGDQELQLNEAMIRLDGAEAAILLKADQTAYTELAERVSSAEVAIDGANAAISLKASQTTVDALGERVSAAEIAIDGANSRIDLKADLIALNGYVKASDFETLWLTVATGAYISTMNAGYIGASNIGVGDTLSAPKVTATNVNTAGLSATSISLGGTAVSSYDLTMGGLVAAKVFSGGNINLGHSHAVSVSDDGTVTLGEVSETGGNFKIADTKAYKDGVSAAIESVTLSADGWDGLTNTVRATNGKYLMVPLPEISIIGGDSFDADHKTTVHAKTPSSAAYLASLSVDASSVYTEGYNAGNSAGYNSGKSDWRPTIVARTAVDTTNKTVTVSVSNLSQTLLTGQVVSAVEVYDAGYNAGAGAGYNNGYSAGYAAAIASLAWSVSGTNVIATFGDGSTKALDVESYVSATADVKYVSSTSTTITVRGWAYAYFNKVNCASVYRSATYDTAD